MSQPTNHAIVLTKTGDFDVIDKIEVPYPSQAKNEVLIKVWWKHRLSMSESLYLTVNLPDLFIRFTTQV